MPESLTPSPDRHDDALEGTGRALPTPRLRRGTSAARAESDRAEVGKLIREIPNFLKLLYRLMRDARVAAVDKAIVAAAIGYVLMPMDLIPDFIPFLGQVDDLYLLALVLDRLFNRAGPDLLVEHWDGQVGTLERVISALDRAGSLLPDRVRELLGQRVG